MPGRAPAGHRQPAAQDPALAARLRTARLAALLGTGGHGPRKTPDGTLDALIARTAEVYSRALTDHTRQSYASRWRQFERWAAERRLPTLPAAPETVMLWLADAVEGDPPASLSALRGRLAGVNRVHVEAGHAAPGDDPAMTILMRGLWRVVDQQPHRPDQRAADRRPAPGPEVYGRRRSAAREGPGPARSDSRPPDAGGAVAAALVRRARRRPRAGTEAA